MRNKYNIEKSILRTGKQIKKQKNKLIYSKELPDKLKAKDELERLRKKLANLQDESNKIQRE